MAATPYEKEFELTVEDGVNQFEIRFPHRGVITKMVCVQAAGVLGGFRMELFNSRRALTEVSESSASTAANPSSAPANFQIGEALVAAAGVDVAAVHGVSYGYTNRDGSPSNGVRRLYVHIHCPDPLPKVFQVTLCADTSDW